MWQSQVEIKHYSVVYFNSVVDKAHMSSTLDSSLMLQHFKCANTIKIHNRLMFNFYLGLPLMKMEEFL